MSEIIRPLGGTDPTPRRGRNKQLVLRALRASNRPLGAYEILRQLRVNGLRSPLQVYRALEQLIADGSALKIESVSAYTLCARADHVGQGRLVFTVCTACGQASEERDPDLDLVLSRLANRNGFKLRNTAVELPGLCENCTHAT